jgi:vitellogenic carboxypeptidase-like protein
LAYFLIGASSLFGLFTENGPFSINEQLQVIPNPGSWNQQFSLLYIDNPVGVGFSSTQDPKGFATSSEVDVANNMYNLLTQFYQAFPQQRQNDLYVYVTCIALPYLERDLTSCQSQHM